MKAYIIIGIVIAVLLVVLVGYRVFCYLMTPTPITVDTKYTPIKTIPCQDGKGPLVNNLIPGPIPPLVRTDSKKSDHHDPLTRLDSNSSANVIHTRRHAFDPMFSSTFSHAFDSLHDPLTSHAFDAAYRPTSDTGLKTGSSVLQAGKDGFKTTHAFDRTLSQEKDTLHHHSTHHAFDQPRH